MVRGGLKPKQLRRRLDIKPDHLYNSTIVTSFINKLNYRGKKTVAEKIFYDAMDLIKEETKENPLDVFMRAIENCRPLVEVRPRRVGGATFQVPVEVPKTRSITLVIKWIIQFAKEKKGKPMANRLAEEIIAASRKEGNVFKKREDTHKMAEANKAFAHYRW